MGHLLSWKVSAIFESVRDDEQHSLLAVFSALVEKASPSFLFRDSMSQALSQTYPQGGFLRIVSRRST
jgi:hypothetical protein